MTNAQLIAVNLIFSLVAITLIMSMCFIVDCTMKARKDKLTTFKRQDYIQAVIWLLMHVIILVFSFILLLDNHGALK